MTVRDYTLAIDRLTIERENSTKNGNPLNSTRIVLYGHKKLYEKLKNPLYVTYYGPEHIPFKLNCKIRFIKRDQVKSHFQFGGIPTDMQFFYEDEIERQEEFEESRS